MANSEAFARIKHDILALVREVPIGRVTTYGTLGRSLDVMPRHVAYILAMLADDERAAVPWHRVVSDAGTINLSKHGRGQEQRMRLRAEGVSVGVHQRVEGLAAILWHPDETTSA
jgi:methylated-DNA-protein-cysteine methyltransferase-like protein